MNAVNSVLQRVSQVSEIAYRCFVGRTSTALSGNDSKSDHALLYTDRLSILFYLFIPNERTNETARRAIIIVLVWVKPARFVAGLRFWSLWSAHCGPVAAMELREICRIYLLSEYHIPIINTFVMVFWSAHWRVYRDSMGGLARIRNNFYF